MGNEPVSPVHPRTYVAILVVGDARCLDRAAHCESDSSPWRVGTVAVRYFRRIVRDKCGAGRGWSASTASRASTSGCLRVTLLLGTAIVSTVWWVSPAIVGVSVLIIPLAIGFLPQRFRPAHAVPVEYAFQLGSPGTHIVQIQYNKHWNLMRVSVDGETVLKKYHLFWVPLRDEFTFDVAGHSVVLVRERQVWKRWWSPPTFAVSVDGTPSYEFSG